MERYFKYFIGLIVVVYVLAMITLERYPNLPDNKVSIGDLANILVGIVAIVTLGFSIWDRYKATQKHSSAVALESYISSIDGLIAKLSDEKCLSDSKFFHIATCHKNLLSCQSHITENEHKIFATTKYETLRTHLELTYHNLQLDDFLVIPSEVKNECNLSHYSQNWQACSYLLVSNWLKHIVRKSPFYESHGYASYGSYRTLLNDYAISMLSMLLAKPLALKPSGELISLFAQFKERCEVEVNRDLRIAFSHYPSLAAHLTLSLTCTASPYELGKYPKLCIAVHDINEKVWISLRGGNFQIHHSIYENLALSKYLEKR